MTICAETSLIIDLQENVGKKREKMEIDFNMSRSGVDVERKTICEMHLGGTSTNRKMRNLCREEGMTRTKFKRLNKHAEKAFQRKG